MKKNILPFSFIAFAILIFSCKKGDRFSSPTYYFSCDINGVYKIWTDSVKVYSHTDGTVGHFYINALSSAGLPTIAYFELSVDNLSGNITAGTYYDTVSTYQTFGFYEIQISTGAVGYNAGQYNPSKIPMGTKHFTIAIESISPTEVKGTFSGDMVKDLNDGSDMDLNHNIHITNGKFNLKVTNN